MHDVVSVDVATTSEFCQSIQKPLEGYLAFSMSEISAGNPTQGSAEHDGMSTGISSALIAWNDLIVSDSDAIEQATKNIQNADMAGAKQILGVGF